MQYCKVNNVEYPAISFHGRMMDPDWDNRESITINISMPYTLASQIFVDGCQFSTVDKYISESTGQEVVEDYPHYEFTIAGPITDNRDGTLKIKMGKPTDLESAYELLYGGI